MPTLGSAHCGGAVGSGSWQMRVSASPQYAAMQSRSDRTIAGLGVPCPTALPDAAWRMVPAAAAARAGTRAGGEWHDRDAFDVGDVGGVDLRIDADRAWVVADNW